MSAAVIIVGSGGHASVVADALLASGRQVLGFVDKDARNHGSQRCGLSVLGDDTVLEEYARSVVQLVNGIGGSHSVARRREVQCQLEARGFRFSSVQHPSAVVSRYARLHEGVQLLARCVVQPGAEIGKGSIVNTAAVVEHDSALGEFVHVACGAVLCGNVSVGHSSHIGAGSVVRQGVRLGAGTVIGIGAAVVKDSEGGVTLVGVPAAAAR